MIEVSEKCKCSMTDSKNAILTMLKLIKINIVKQIKDIVADFPSELEGNVFIGLFENLEAAENYLELTKLVRRRPPSFY